MAPPTAGDIAALDNDTYANSSKGPRATRAKTWNEMAARCGHPPLPLTPDLVKLMGAAFKAAKFRSTKIYFQEAARRHIAAGLPEIPTSLALLIKNVVRSATRGLAPPRLKPAFRVDDLADSVDKAVRDDRPRDMLADRPRLQRDFFLLAVALGTCFMAKGI